jgi:hypothetical protein
MSKSFRRRAQPGRDLDGKPRSVYFQNLTKMSDHNLVQETMRVLMVLRVNASDRGADSHWQAQACHKEANIRRKPELYLQAENRVRGGQ